MGNELRVALIIGLGIAILTGCQEREKPEDILKKSAFYSKRKKAARGPSDDAGRAGSGQSPSPSPDSSASPGQSPSAPPAAQTSYSLTVSTTRFCSNSSSMTSGSNLKTASNITIEFLNKDGVLIKSVDGSSIRNQILDKNRFTLNFDNGQLPPDTYKILLCDESKTDNHCVYQGVSSAMSGHLPTVPTGPRGGRWAPGLLGALDVRANAPNSFDVNLSANLKGSPSRVGQTLGVLAGCNKRDSRNKMCGSRVGASVAGDPYPEPSQTPSPTPSPSPEPEDPPLKCDEEKSPLMVDLDGSGINLSAPHSNGMMFDIDGDGQKDHISWPLNPNNAFVVMDRNGNGQIDDINEMFGNNTVGPDGRKAPNGFIALGKYDNNDDKIIDGNDSVYNRLRLWTDENRNGRVEPGELSTLSEKGVRSISLIVVEAPSDDVAGDEYGNLHKQRSKVRMNDNSERLIVDIWFRIDEAY